MDNTHGRKRKERALEKALEDSFPASDPPTVTSPSRSITGDDEAVAHAATQVEKDRKDKDKARKPGKGHGKNAARDHPG